MPTWIVAVIGTAAFITAFGVIWTKVVKPFSRGVTQADLILPLIPVLADIASQFRNNGGSTLRDVVDRLEAAAVRQEKLVNEMLVTLGIDHGMSEVDRLQVSSLVRAVAQLQATVVVGAAGVLRIEEDQAKVADHLASKEHNADVTDGPEGAAADAAAKSLPEETV